MGAPSFSPILGSSGGVPTTTDRAYWNKLCEAFRITKSIELDDYWEKVVERLTDSNWWNAEQPHDPQQKRIWLGRAAFLDVLFYEPD